MIWKERIYRIGLSALLFFDHGFPKLAAWLFNWETWGPHVNFYPKTFFSGLAAVIEFICPLLIIFGIHVRWSALVISSMLLFTAFSLPLPWLHIRVPIEGFNVPFAIIVSKEFTIIWALSFMAITLFCRNWDTIWNRNRRTHD